MIPALLRELGVEVVELNCAPDGHFAHNPEPIPANLTEISARVPAEKADLGIVVDPDVDRLALVCEDGTMFGEEYTLVAVADYVLSHTKGATVSNLSSSRALRDVTERHGCRYYAAAVGEVNVVTKMKEVGAVIGHPGEGEVAELLGLGRQVGAGLADDERLPDERAVGEGPDDRMRAPAAPGGEIERHGDGVALLGQAVA